MNLIAAAVASLSTSFASSASLAELSRARSAHPALAPLARPSDVIPALAVDSPLSLKERDAVVLALLTEHQRTRHPLWQSLLVATYEPMLHKIAKRTLGVSRDDARQGALAGFLEAIAKVRIDPPPQVLSLTLRHATERIAFGQACFTEEPQAEPVGRREPDPRDLEETLEKEDQMRRIVRELTSLFDTEADAREILEVLLYARSGRSQLLEYVDTTYASLTRAKRDAIFARLWRMRARALAHLHSVFGGELETELERFAA
jgi:hypothetical protein